MFSKVAFIASAALLAVAAPGGGGGSPPPASQCNTGPVQCCNSVQQSNSGAAALLLGLLGVVLQGVAVPIGVTCSPISVIGAGSGAVCNAEPVCCENNSFNGIIAIGCSPVNLNL